jgi:hypothetical protein
MTSIPFVPFDPTEVGPKELFWQKWSDFTGFISDNLPWLIGGGIALIAIWVYAGLPLPEIPTWMPLAFYVSIASVPWGWIIGKWLARGLHERRVEVLSEQDPGTGDQRLIQVDPDRYANMMVLNHNGEMRDLDFLKSINVNGVRAWEVDSYDPERNVAIASWQAGETNASIRRQKSQISRIKNELEREADKALELLSNHPDIIREHATEVANRIIKVAEGVEVPQDGQLHETLNETLEEADPSEDLLRGQGGVDEQSDDVEGVDVEEDPDEGGKDSMMERARAMATDGSGGSS